MLLRLPDHPAVAEEDSVTDHVAVGQHEVVGLVPIEVPAQASNEPLVHAGQVDDCGGKGSAHEPWGQDRGWATHSRDPVFHE